MSEIVEVKLDRRDFQSDTIDEVKSKATLKSFFDLASIRFGIRAFPFTTIIAGIAFFFGSDSTFTDTLVVMLVLNFLGTAMMLGAAYIYKHHRKYVREALDDAQISQSICGRYMTLKFDTGESNLVPVMLLKQLVSIAESFKIDPVKSIQNFNNATGTLATICIVTLFAFVAPALSSGTFIIMAVLVAIQVFYTLVSYTMRKNILTALESMDEMLKAVDGSDTKRSVQEASV